MIKYSTAVLMLLTVAFLATYAQQPAKGGTEKMEKADIVNNVKVKMYTTLGDIVLELYDDTPLHRDNFLKLMNEGYYDGVLFHRVIKDFMIQTGDPDSKNAAPEQMLGSGGPDYTIEAEFRYPERFHKRGALAAARTGDQVNPERRSSASQFYIVTGNTYTPEQLQQIEQRLVNSQYDTYFGNLARMHREEIVSMRQAGDKASMDSLQEKLYNQTMSECHPAKMSERIKEIYTTIGGTPHLDGQYTVFGEVIEGMDVVDKIQNMETGAGDRPKEDIRVLKMEVLK